MDLLEKIKTAGVVGAGGAGFPTQVKLDCRADCLLVNAAECGICETFACPMGLSPRRVNAYIKKTLSGAGIRYQKGDQKLEASPMRQYRKIAPAKIMARMGLFGLYNSQAEDFEELEADTVRIPLKQHIGAPASPVVAEGEYVERGCLIAKADGKVSANIHASIAGVVAKVGEYIEITRKNK